MTQQEVSLPFYQITTMVQLAEIQQVYLTLIWVGFLGVRFEGEGG